MAMNQELLRDVVLGIIRTYQEISIDLVIEYAWQNEDIEQLYDLPDVEVRRIIDSLVKENIINLDSETDVVTYIDSPSAHLDIDSRVDDVAKWELSMLGSYERFNGEPIDIRLIWNEIQTKPITIFYKSNKPDVEDNPSPHFSTNRNEISFIWAFEAVRCTCHWASDRFFLSGVMFKEPSKEVYEYAVTQLDPLPDFIMKSIPFTGLYLLYSYMKKIIQSIYPDVVFKLTKVGESRVKEGYYD